MGRQKRDGLLPAHNGQFAEDTVPEMRGTPRRKYPYDGFAVALSPQGTNHDGFGHAVFYSYAYPEPQGFVLAQMSADGTTTRASQTVNILLRRGEWLAHRNDPAI
jgi:hypothetical protein